MRKIMLTIKKFTAILGAVLLMLTLLFSFCGAGTVFAAEAGEAELVSRIKESYGQGQLIFDYAMLLTQEDMDELQQLLAAYSDTYQMDAIVVTVNDLEDYSNVEGYADHIFYEAGLGQGSDKSGSMLLVSMADRDVMLYTHGLTIRYLTDDRIDDVLYNGVLPYMKEGDMKTAFARYVEGVTYYTKAGIPQDQVNVNPDTGETDPYQQQTTKKALTIPEIIISAIAAVLAGLFPTKSVKSKYAMQQEKAMAENFHIAYRKEAAFAYTEGEAASQLIDRRIQSVPIPVQQPQNRPGGTGGSHTSTVHTGMGGSVHGGKTGKF